VIRDKARLTAWNDNGKCASLRLGLLKTTEGPDAELNGVTGRVKLIAWPYTLPEVVPDVQATWESFCESWGATHGCGLSMGAVLNVATRLAWVLVRGRKSVKRVGTVRRLSH
jgi:hypothetical protein